ncbi:unnamed protein product, partial [Scytosiphon promiscuus]
ASVVEDYTHENNHTLSFFRSNADLHLLCKPGFARKLTLEKARYVCLKMARVGKELSSEGTATVYVESSPTLVDVKGTTHGINCAREAAEPLQGETVPASLLLSLTIRVLAKTVSVDH